MTPRPDAEIRPSAEEIRRRLARAVRRVCPAWLEASRDDLVQAATLRVLEIQKKSEGDRDFSSSYLQKVAFAVLVDEIRRLRRRSEVPLEPDAYPVDDADAGTKPASPSPLPSPEGRLAQRQMGKAIADCLGGLKAERRQALVLFLQGHSVPDTARLLGWGAKKTENLVYRGKADLQQCLEKKGYKP